MFEENNNINDLDSGFKAILDKAQEPAPAHVWDRIEADLDKIARRRVAVLWFRRAAVGVAAAAALTFGVFFGHNGEEDIVNPVAGGSAIAVVEQQETPVQTEEAVISGTESAPSLLAMAHKVDPKKEFASEEIPATEASEVHEATENIDSKPVTKTENRPAAPSKSRTENNAQTERFPDVWPEDEPQKNRIRTSLVLSGITGTNSAQNSTRRNPMKRPAISAAPKKTGIKETSTNTIYGIPVSAGIGVRIGFTPKWSLGAGINYTLLTRKFYGTYTMVGNDGGILKDISSDIRNSQHYIADLTTQRCSAVGRFPAKRTFQNHIVDGISVLRGDGCCEDKDQQIAADDIAHDVERGDREGDAGPVHRLIHAAERIRDAHEDDRYHHV